MGRQVGQKNRATCGTGPELGHIGIVCETIIKSKKYCWQCGKVWSTVNTKGGIRVWLIFLIEISTLIIALVAPEYRHCKAATFALKSETYQTLSRALVLGAGIKFLNTGIVIGDKLDASCSLRIYYINSITKYLSLASWRLGRSKFTNYCILKRSLNFFSFDLYKYATACAYGL